MKLTINNKQENQLLLRTDVKATLEFEGTTPSNGVVLSSIAKKLGASEDLVVVKQIATEFSLQRAKVTAVVYKTLEAKEKNEVMTKFLRVKVEADAKAQAEAKAAAKEAKVAAAAAKKAEAEAKAAEAAAPAVEEPVAEKPAAEEKTE